MFEIKLPIISQRLLIRPFAPADEEALYEMESDPEVKRFTGGVLTRSQTKDLLQRFINDYKRQNFGALAITDKQTTEFLGLIGVVFDAALKEIELFWGLKREAWNKGYALEACQAMIACLFNDAQIGAVTAKKIDPQNINSLKLVEKIDGMVCECVHDDGKKDYRKINPQSADL